MYKAGVPISAQSGEKVAPGRAEPFEGNLRSGEMQPAGCLYPVLNRK